MTDRPWAKTLWVIGLRQHSGQLSIETDRHRFSIAFRDGEIAAATSPLAADAVTRIALTNHLITATQASDIQRRVTFSPDHDEVEQLADLLQFSPEQAETLRRRVIVQRAARTFSFEAGTFVVDDVVGLTTVPGVSVDVRHAIYLGARLHLAEHRLIEDLRQQGSHFILKLEAGLSRYGFEPGSEPILEALRAGTSLPELEAAHRDIDPRSMQAMIYALWACDACMPVSRTMTQPSLGRTSTTSSPALGRTNTTSSPSVGRSMTLRGQPDDGRIPAARQPLVSPRTATQSSRTTTTPVPVRTVTAMPPPDPRGTTTQPPLAADTASFSNTTPLASGTPGPRTSTTMPLPRTHTTSSPTSYSKVVSDTGENTPIRPRSTSDPAAARTRTPMPTTPRADQRPTTPVPTRTLTPPPSEPDGGVKFSASTTPPPMRTPAATRAPSPPSPTRPPSMPSPNDSGRFDFGEQRTPLPFGEQRTPSPFADQRTPNGFEKQPTPDRTPTGGTRPPETRTTSNNSLAPPSADNAAAAAEAFKRGELAMKRDQPGEAVLEFKTAVDLSPGDVDYAAMLAWAKFAAAGDKHAISIDTRKALEKAIFKSNNPERARFYLGRVERMLGRDKEALRHFQEVVDLKPNHAEAAAEIRAIEGRIQKGKKK